jgi:predicted nucleic acid-binding protein
MARLTNWELPVNKETLNRIVQFLLDAKKSAEFMRLENGVIDVAEVFSLERLRELLANPLLTPEWLQLTLEGRILDLRQSVGFKVVQDKKLFFLDKDLLNQALAKRAAVVLEGLDLMDSALAYLVTNLEQTMPCSMSNCEAFFSRSGNEAYNGHRDSDDVLVIQIAGTKRWRVHQPQQRRYLNNAPLTDSMMGPIVGQFELNPGDIMFLKAGVPHKCTTVTDHSLHLSFDLIDRTLSIEQITKAANAHYNNATAEPHAPVSAVIDKYIDYLTSDRFKTEIEKASADQKREAALYRQKFTDASKMPNLNLKK